MDCFEADYEAWSAVAELDEVVVGAVQGGRLWVRELRLVTPLQAGEYAER